MRVRTYLRVLREERELSITDVCAATGLARGEVSMFERGHAIPRDDQADRMEQVYGPRERWYPPTVARALLHDAGDCRNCGDELDPDASARRRYHPDCPRRPARRLQEALP